MPPRTRRELLLATIAAIIIAAILQYLWLSSSASRGTPGSAIPNSMPLAARVPAADFGSEQVSDEMRLHANWVVASKDNQDNDFLVVDKSSARLLVFDSKARLRAATPVLLGAAKGDHTVPGIGMRPIAEVKPEERTTPAGRFVAEYGRNANGEDVVWVDYDAAVSMHRVRANNPKEQRLERLATPTPDDNRISWGCINVPATFFDAQILPLFRTARPIVYVLPEVETRQAVFGSHDVPPLEVSASIVEILKPRK